MLLTCVCNYLLFVVSLGIWHNARYQDCENVEKKGRNLGQRLNGLLNSIYRFLATRPDLTVIWRTTGFTDGIAPDRVHRIDNFVMKHIDMYNHQNAPSPHRGTIAYVHWSGAVEPRSFGANRLVGDNPSHYGLQPRMVLLQMIANKLKDLEESQTVTVIPASRNCTKT